MCAMHGTHSIINYGVHVTNECCTCVPPSAVGLGLQGSTETPVSQQQDVFAAFEDTPSPVPDPPQQPQKVSFSLSYTDVSLATVSCVCVASLLSLILSPLHFLLSPLLLLLSLPPSRLDFWSVLYMCIYRCGCQKHHRHAVGIQTLQTLGKH